MHEAHAVCDRSNFLLYVNVTLSNMHDNAALNALYQNVTGDFYKII